MLSEKTQCDATGADDRQGAVVDSHQRAAPQMNEGVAKVGKPSDRKRKKDTQYEHVYDNIYIFFQIRVKSYPRLFSSPSSLDF